MLFLFAVIFTLWLAASAMAGEFTGPVIRVLDGDTIEVLHKKHPERIRLSGIDCPEKGQPFEEKAMHAMSALVFGKEVTVQLHGKDKDRHTLADVVLPDGTHVNNMMVAGGWCWWYPKYALQNRDLKRLESEARIGKRGLWADPYPVPPWEWQKWRKRP
jgi:endonuclease YncB( thermonuclease family)